MLISTIKTGDKTEIIVEGRIDTTTAPEFQAAITKALEDGSVIINLTKVNYVSSAGLRAFLSGQKTSKSKGLTMTVTGVVPEVKEVFDMTGFSDILTFA
ncbi:MAG: STAS domain-containing protein [Ruminococcus sp.]|jgi:anti-anti-sigma factor|nr:STAS domain-containing protein [Ruminococcus sp.]